MLKKIIITLFALSFFISGLIFADTLIVGGQHYDIQPSKLKTCGQTGSPEFTAALFLLNAAQALGEQLRLAACQADSSKDCSPIAVTKSGIDQIFSFIRSYPSIYSNDGCQDLRTNCENRCITSKIYSEKICIIECNQYETWNR